MKIFYSFTIGFCLKKKADSMRWKFVYLFIEKKMSNCFIKSGGNGSIEIGGCSLSVNVNKCKPVKNRFHLFSHM